MTGAEIGGAAAVGKTVAKVAGEDAKTKEALIAAARNTPAFKSQRTSTRSACSSDKPCGPGSTRRSQALVRVDLSEYDEKFERDLAEKLSPIPEEHLQPPSTLVAVPILDSLAY